MHGVRGAGSVLFTLSLTLMIGACAAPSSGSAESAIVGRTRQKIVNGVPSTAAQDATVMLTQNGELACTATLITPNLILTARHCVSNLDESTECGSSKSEMAVTSFGVALGVDASGSSSVAKGKRLFVPSTKSLCGADIALIQLDKDLKENKRAVVRFTKFKVGEKTTAVGYGDDGTGDVTPGRFQRTGVQIVALGPKTNSYKARDGQSLQVDVPEGDVQTTESTCFGDSGGPLFDADGQVVGVTSRGIDDACIDRPTIWTGIPQHEQFIRDAAEAAGHPLEDAASSGDVTSTSSKDDSSSDDSSSNDKKPSKKVPQLVTTGCAVGSIAPSRSATSPFAAMAVVAFAGALARRKRGS
jgi:secreted trypsin-like serine protease